MILNSQKRFQFIVLTFVGLVSLINTVTARENIGSSGKTVQPNVNVIAATCSPATAKTVLELNNVRTTILNGGDMWWETGQSNAKYEIPKGSNNHSLFAGALWIGGVDNGNQLKVAAMTYRQTGNDFWPGPLDTVNVSTDDSRCNYYDKHYRITRREVEDFIGWNRDPAAFPGYVVPTSILNWPANPYFANESRNLAPYHDGNGNSIYDPPTAPVGENVDFDYPNYNVNDEQSCDQSFLFGDETLWWVFNDRGNIHSESQGQPIGLEIQAQAFAFSTNDEVNNMTFYKYKIINRNGFALFETYFGQWVDSDLGGANDDYVGCDVRRGLGFTYNGDGNDEPFQGQPGYGDELPCLGVDFFQGPIADAGDGIDNDRDGSTDETGEQIIMSKFIYYNNDFTTRGNPETASDFYNYCVGKWKDGTPITYGGNGYNTGAVCNFMFPDTTDPAFTTPWTEVIAGNSPADRRFFQSAGPFTLQPGAINYITVGVVWARAPKGSGNTASIDLMKKADDKAQLLFDNCFKVINGPDAPDMTIQELDKELILYLSSKPTSNNYLEKYSEIDPSILATDNTYKFEGYQIFQLKDPSIAVTEIRNPDKARLVKQVDIKNGVTQLINFNFDATLNANIPVEMVNAEDKGILHSFSITEDQFATGDKRLINHKQYYYLVISYAYNQYKQYIPDNVNNLDGQKKPYLQGRRNIKAYTGIPHNPSPEANGTEQHSAYGTGVKLTRVEGQGNGGMVLDLTQETINRILTNGTSRDTFPKYESARGPVNIKVIDPLNVPEGEFTFSILDSITTGNLTDAYWTLKNNTTGEVVNALSTIAVSNEQLIPQWGLSVTIQQVANTGNAAAINNGFLEATMTFADNSKQWLTGVADQDGYTLLNWIRSGTQQYTGTTPDPFRSAFNDQSGEDNNEHYEKILGGTWAPYALAAWTDAPTAETPIPYNLGAPAFRAFTGSSTLAFLSSVDVVITGDKSKWTRCPVLELQDETALAQGNAKKLDPRKAPSVNRDGVVSTGGSASTDPNDPNYISANGMGWFPGYAINIETGERLNMAFGEDSWLVSENGRDMIWNPTKNSTDFTIFPPKVYLGGKHYIYIFNHSGDGNNDMPKYDAGQYLMSKIGGTTAPTDLVKGTQVLRHCIWVNMPLLTESFASLSKFGENLNIPTDVKVRLRVAKPYTRAYSGYQGTLTDLAPNAVNGDRPLYNFSSADIETHKDDLEAAKNALDLINVVPNPYYAYSSYETSQIDNRVKITNLPEKCTVSIYTLNGSLLRKYKKDDPKTSLDWDLKNQYSVPIASGLYIIHVDVPGVGEKILKWFGVLRPIDLESF